MLINAQKLLQKAKEEKRAVPATNFIDLDSARAFVRVAYEEKKPIILSFAQAHKAYLSLEEAAAVGKVVAANIDVPIVLHLDHGEDFDYIKRAIELGFTSVMIDASMYELEENIRKTCEVADYAHSFGVAVEAEIGHVGQGESYGDSAEGNAGTDSIYTSVEQAVHFVKSTNVDSLAVSIGTAHGIYRNQDKPVLDFVRLKELAEHIDIPLVLHGGSGSGDDNLRRCAHEGISKINVFTDFLISAMEEIKIQNPPDYLALKACACEGMQKKLRHCLALFS